MDIERSIFTSTSKKNTKVPDVILAMLREDPEIERPEPVERLVAAQGYRQRQLPPDFTESLFTESESVMDRLDMREDLSRFAEENGYKSEMDYVMCSLYPEFEKSCRDYYSGDGDQLLSTMPDSKIQAIDNIIAQAIFFMHKQKKEDQG